jgi:hypothetical protein
VPEEERRLGGAQEWGADENIGNYERESNRRVRKVGHVAEDREHEKCW